MPSQLPLALVHPPAYERETFFSAPSNAAALAAIDRWPSWTAPVAVVSGPAGSGKTHLAHIWAERSQASIVNAAGLDLSETVRLGSGSSLVVEDIDPGNVPEAALFHLINGAQESQASLLLTSRAAAETWRIGLPDLRSRLRLALPIPLGWPDDELIRKVLVKLFADRQIAVERTVLDYILTRMERSLSHAASLVEALDREALARGSAITRPLAARLIGEGAA